MLMNALRRGAAGGIFKFVIFGFLLFAVGGMVFMDIGGFFRNGGVHNSDVAKVGRERISLPVFDRSVRRAISQIGIGPSEAYKAGYIRQILDSEIRARLMQQAGDDLGLRVDRKRVAAQIREMIAPMVQPGQNPKDVLAQILLNQGMSEGELARAIGNEMTTNLLSSAIAGGFASLPDSLVNDLYAYQNEKRDIVFVTFLDSDIKSVKEPTDDMLKDLYEKTKEIYATPETRTLQLVKLDADTLKKTIAIDESEIRANYDTNIDLYTEKEQRTLETGLFEKEEDAKAVAEKAKSGGGLQAAIKATTRRDSDYLGEKTFETESIPAELKADVSAAKSGDIVGPVKTSIGWQVVAVKKITPSQTKPYESVKKEIRDELLENKIIDEQYNLSGQVEDMLAGGASLDDVKKDVDIEVVNLPDMNAYGQTKAGQDALKDFAKDKNFILENGFQLGEGETSQMSEGTNGEFVAVHVAKVQPKVYAPFEQVKDGMLKRWMTDQRSVENRLASMQAVEELKKSKQSPEDFARAQNKVLQARNSINRTQAPNKPLTPQSWENIFEAKPNEPTILNVDGGFAIMWVTKTALPEKVDASSKDYKDFKTGLLKATQNEAFALYGDSKAKKYGARINEKLLEQSYGQRDESN